MVCRGEITTINKIIGVSGPILMDDVECVGDELSLLDCPATLLDSNCDHSEDIGIDCSLGVYESKTWIILLDQRRIRRRGEGKRRRTVEFFFNK